MGSRSITAFALSLLLVVPALIDAGCAARGPDVNGAITTIAGDGVATYDSYAPGAPIVAISGTRSAMRFTRWQLKNMLAQADAGMGMSGASLDRMAVSHLPKNAPSISQLIAAWVTKYQSPLARYARAHMSVGALDPKHTAKTLFPLLVVALFVADIARMKNAPAKTANNDPGFERWIAAPAEAAGVCSTVSNFVSGVVSDVEGALADVPVVGGILVELWGIVVGVVQKVVSTVLAPILAIVTAVSGALAAITTIASTLSPWVITVTSNPTSLTLGSDPITGVMTANVQTGAIDWPSEVADCAQQLGGIDVKSISSEGAPVTWTPSGDIPAYATVDSAHTDTALKNDTASLTYNTLAQSTPSPASCQSTQSMGSITADVSIERVDVQHLAKQLSDLAFSQMNKTVYQNLKPFFDEWIATAGKSIEQYVHSPATGQGNVPVNILVYDTSKGGCTPTPAPTPTPTATPDQTSLVGDWSCVINATVHNKELGDFHISVNTSLSFTKTNATGFSNEGASMSGRNVYNGPGTGAQHQGSGGYTYTPSGANSGTLNADGKIMHLNWSGKNAWSTTLTSPVSKRSYLYQCHR